MIRSHVLKRPETSALNVNRTGQRASSCVSDHFQAEGVEGGKYRKKDTHTDTASKSFCTPTGQRISMPPVKSAPVSSFVIPADRFPWGGKLLGQQVQPQSRGSPMCVCVRESTCPL